MICPTCHGNGWIWWWHKPDPLTTRHPTNYRPCPDCIGGAAYCCDGAPCEPDQERTRAMMPLSQSSVEGSSATAAMAASVRQAPTTSG